MLMVRRVREVTSHSIAPHGLSLLTFRWAAEAGRKVNRWWREWLTLDAKKEHRRRYQETLSQRGGGYKYYALLLLTLWRAAKENGQVNHWGKRWVKEAKRSVFKISGKQPTSRGLRTSMHSDAYLPPWFFISPLNSTEMSTRNYWGKMSDSQGQRGRFQGI